MIPRILIAGVGNVLLQDDGFGPHAIERLQANYEIGKDVELLDLGTPGLDFVDYLVGRDVLIILDALSSGGEPGEILTFDREQLNEQMPNMRLSAHQPCLQETLFTAQTAERLSKGRTARGYRRRKLRGQHPGKRLHGDSDTASAGICRRFTAPPRCTHPKTQ